jgi:hypothetical protein
LPFNLLIIFLTFGNYGTFIFFGSFLYTGTNLDQNLSGLQLVIIFYHISYRVDFLLRCILTSCLFVFSWVFCFISSVCWHFFLIFIMIHAACWNTTSMCINYTSECHKTILMGVKIILCVWKSHFVCQNHSVEITLCEKK